MSEVIEMTLEELKEYIEAMPPETILNIEIGGSENGSE
ncbi:hypothetical protein M2145_001005 [Lachnospiraceae bacterium PF1-21]